MPFTFSHPALILPLTVLPRRWVSLTGLTIGSVVPDFEFFLTMRGQEVYSHSWLGLFIFNLPLALLLAFLFHDLVRNPLVDHLPQWLRTRLAFSTTFQWDEHYKTHWGVILASIIIGIVSHFFWDSFTHEGATLVRAIPLLSSTIHFLGYTLPVYSFLQYFSSLVGLLVIGGFLLQLPKEPGIKPNKGSWRYWSAIGLISLAVFFIKGVWIGIDPKNDTPDQVFSEYIIIAVAAFLLTTTIVSIITAMRSDSTNEME